ncbi:MAG: spermine synthase [Candidatus Melainabacteria bacterium HGW-Melainabacteria-1]|nr:MAG: spermine synthase [Candidatus Melainabacteria bacterium HGW-Melainabacteria-1]
MSIGLKVSIYILFTLSGFAGLIYESIWSRYLKLLLGHSSYGQILTLMIFMGGLAVGAWIGGRQAARMSRPLLLYAAAEGLIGLGGLIYHQLYQQGSQQLFHVLASLQPPGWAGFAIKSLFACLITAPWAILLGMTFPALAIGLMRLSGDQGRFSLPWLYFTNSLGGAAGVLGASYWLVPAYGTVGSLSLASMLNLLLAGAFYLIARSGSLAKTLPERQTPQSTEWPWLLLSVALLTGLSSFVYEVAWLRLLSLVLGASTHAFDLMVSAFIFGLACGGLFARVLHQRLQRPILALAVMQLLMGLAAALSLCLYEGLFSLINQAHLVFQPSQEAFVAYSIFKYGLCILLMFPASFCAGTTLPLITWSLLRRGGNESDIGAVYSWNTLGSILGAFLGGMVLLPMLQLKWTLLSGALIDLLLGLALLSTLSPGLPLLAGTALASLLLLWPSLTLKLDAFTLASGMFRKHLDSTNLIKEQITIRDGRTATISFHEQPNLRVIKTNGKPDASLVPNPGPGDSSDEGTQLALAIYPYRLMQGPYRAAMIGLGSGMTAHHLLADPWLKQLDLIEIEPVMHQLAKGFLPFNQRVYDSPKLKLIFDDAKSYFFSHGQQYDVIISEPSNPWVSGVASLFSEEFYAYVRQFLTPEGVLVQWIHTYEFDDELLLAILSALQKQFGHIGIYGVPEAGGRINNGDLILIASQQPLRFLTPRVLPELEADFARAGTRLEDYADAGYLASTQSLDPLLATYNPNSDFYPLVDNGAEKAFFLKSHALLPEILSNTPAYYQDLAEPGFEALNTKRLRARQHELDSGLRQLEVLLQLPDSAYKYKQLNEVFFQLVDQFYPLMDWKTPVLRQLDQALKSKGHPADDLQYQILAAGKRSPNDLTLAIQTALSAEQGLNLRVSLIRLMFLHGVKQRDRALCEKMLERWIAPNPKVSQIEKLLLASQFQRL